MVNKLRLASLRNDEAIQYLNQFLGTVVASFSTTPIPAAVDTLRLNLQTLLNQIKQAHVADNEALLSDAIAALDADRDVLVNALVQLVKALTFHPKPTHRAAALLLHHDLGLYGDSISGKTYNAETAAIAGILTDWATKPGLVAAVITLGLADWTTALQEANVAFEAKMAERNNEVASGLPFTLREKRVAAAQVYAALVAKLRGHYEVADGAEPWMGLAAALNAITEGYSDMLAVRSGRAAAGAARKAAENPA